MSSKIKVLYITKYNQKEILEKPDNFTYYIKSIMNSNLIDVYLLNPLSLQKGNSIQVLIALVKTIKDINPDILYLGGPARSRQVGSFKTNRNPKM